MAMIMAKKNIFKNQLGGKFYPNGNNNKHHHHNKGIKGTNRSGGKPEQ